ncbi:DUF2934 domain-containing protein [Burkholderia multivorans]|jgi:hypothetical protein|uniref:DUF2934 domain-containing protein n=2 Tax=Burkholderia multivorans TaxID=87883 RepID=A0A8E2RY86_9BURK|nr:MULTISPECIES: DUF2934 domain-containing protein [Burkholderia]AJY15002.1 hypothetical protein NP80_5604 [Burkholderia multivorans ATCC BAA-247]AOJ96938.1 hypothetical protein WK22_28445 [Burkholderia multivorans]AVR20191.1 DUF2934 domain-containing protein [Burkholderia multivorans]EEE07219.1 conserved hypothetical protein [Burkholderia multivorans CGD2]EEE13588.1 conserved hypothetical protein [Burkholderia multivorans CGD2M]
MAAPRKARRTGSKRIDHREKMMDDRQNVKNGEREAQIRERAYRLWQDAGSPDGNAEAYWLMAERQLDAEGGATAATEPPLEQSAQRRIPGEPLQEDDSALSDELAHDRRRT